LKPGFHLIDARVEITWVPGAFQLRVGGSQRAPGPPTAVAVAQLLHRRDVPLRKQRDVAVQVEFESKL
jgi:hypothetical protein